MTDATINGLPGPDLRRLLDDQRAQLMAERQQREVVEARAVAQLAKLADNNAALARMNHRLTQQLDRLRAEHDKLSHLHTGQRAVAGVKEMEHRAEIAGLKEVLQASWTERQLERQRLHTELQAKKEVIGYLQWRLDQAQCLLEQRGLLPPTPRAVPSIQTPSASAAALAAAAAAADAEHRLGDSLYVLPDESGSTQGSSSAPSEAISSLARTVHSLGQRGLAGIPAATWMGSVPSDKENVGATTPTGPAHPPNADTAEAVGDVEATFNEDTVEDAIGEGTPPPTAISHTVQSLALRRAGPREPLSPLTIELLETEDASLAVTERVQAGLPASAQGAGERAQSTQGTAPLSATVAPSGVPSQPAVAAEALPAAQASAGISFVKPQGEEGRADEEEEATEKDSKHTWLLATPGTAHASEEGGSTRARSPLATPPTAPRTSSRSNRRRISYALPSSRSKLRQGDAFTFGDPSAIKAKKKPSSRTKPRAKYATGSTTAGKSSRTGQPAAVQEEGWETSCSE